MFKARFLESAFQITKASSISSLLVILLCFLPLNGFAQREKYTAYINQYMNMAVDQMVRSGIPASITMAQALLESQAGQSRLAVKGKNHFGIKCGGRWNGPYMLVNDDAPNEHFRVYRTVAESYDDHSLFLRSNQRYSRLFTLNIYDYKGWARGLKAAGYATNPRYADILIQLIEDYDLQKLDRMAPGRGNKGSVAFTHEVWMCNRNFYTIARSGDTFKSLSKEMGVSERKLRKYNEVDRHYQLQEGDIVFFEKKQRQADREWSDTYHRMKDGESLHQLSQRYGMRVETLYKINHLPNDYVPNVGDLILLRK